MIPSFAHKNNNNFLNFPNPDPAIPYSHEYSIHVPSNLCMNIPNRVGKKDKLSWF